MKLICVTQLEQATKSISIALLSLTLVTATPKALLRSCDKENTIGENIRWATHIFSGRAVATQKDANVIAYKFKVDRQLSRVFLSDTIFVLTAARPAACGLAI